jgi:hypothetical protein
MPLTTRFAVFGEPGKFDAIEVNDRWSGADITNHVKRKTLGSAAWHPAQAETKEAAIKQVEAAGFTGRDLAR